MSVQTDCQARGGPWTWVGRPGSTGACVLDPAWYGLPTGSQLASLREWSAGAPGTVSARQITLNGVVQPWTSILSTDLVRNQRGAPTAPLDPLSALIAGTVVSIGLTATGIGAAAGVANVTQQLYETQRQNMALNIGQLLGGIGQAIGGIQGGAVQPYTQGLSSVLMAGGQIASAFAPQPAASPISYPYGSPMAQPVMAAAGPVMRTVGSGMLAGAGGAALRDLSKQIAQKASQFLGKTLSTAGLVAVARKMAKFFTSPEAIATYLGVTVGELYTVWSYEAAKKRRRINPANGKALRRAASRIKSFHKLCQHTDLLKTRRRAPSRSCSKVC